MAITYDVPNNKITVTGYSELTPCDFTDLYNADKAGTLSLHARTGIAGTDGAVVATDRAERPADYIVLGGASNDLYITVANWNGTTATIRITGTDRDGTAQTEDIVVNNNGQYNTTKWFKTITHTQITAFTATSFDYDLTQGQWGVVWRPETSDFIFDCPIYLGDGTVATWFNDNLKTVLFSGYAQPMGIYIENNANLQLGVLVDAATKSTQDGCNIQAKFTSLYGGTILGVTGSDIKLYSCSFLGSSRGEKQYVSIRSGRIWNCNITNGGGMRSSSGEDVFNVTLSHTEYGAYYGESGATFDQISLYGVKYVLYAYSNFPVTFKNVYARNCVYAGYMNWTEVNSYFINADIDNWNIKWSGTNTGWLVRQYTFNLKVIDKDGVNIPDGATVKIWDEDDTLVVDTTTASGVIAEQTISRGYYNQANGNTLQDASPHTIEISKAGYQTYKKVFTMDKIDWTIRLIHTTVNPDQEAF